MRASRKADRKSAVLLFRTCLAASELLPIEKSPQKQIAYVPGSCTVVGGEGLRAAGAWSYLCTTSDPYNLDLSSLVVGTELRNMIL